MTTGVKFAAFNLKSLIGYQDLGVRGFTALRASHIESTLSRWDTDGVFGTKLVIAANGANGIQITGSSKATDGLGRIMTIASAYKKDALFQNTAAITYHVGMMYAEIPAGLKINPRTGQPQFDQYVEEVGFVAAPTSVTDNGNNTITFNVNSVTEAGVSNAGRICRVWKVVPATGGVTFAIALEECTVVFGANNTITTTGKFGQTAISTTAADYLVVCMGPRVARNTDLSAVGGVCYLGTVTGNGGTPVTFSNTNQTLLRTFQDASQIAYTPVGWLSPGSTNVQSALDALVNGLQLATGGASVVGAARIGVNAPSFQSRANTGIGNVADGTFTTTVTLQEVLQSIDLLVRRRQSFMTKADGTGQPQDGDESTGTQSLNTIMTTATGNRPWWLRSLSNASFTPYTLTADSGPNACVGSYLMGEFSDLTQASPHLRRTRLSCAAARAVSGGKWQRLWMDAASGFWWRFGGAGQRSGLIMEDCGINGGGFVIEAHSTPASDDHGFNFRNMEIIPKDEATKAFDSTMRLGHSTVGWVWGVFENILVKGPSATQTTPAAPGYALLSTSQLNASISSSLVSTQGRPLAFRDCVFVMTRAADTGLVLWQSQQQVVFENCRFFGIVGRGAGALFSAATASNITLRDCVFFDPEGQCVDFAASTGCNGLIDNCTVVAGIGGAATIATPIPFTATGDLYGLSITNTKVILGSAVFRAAVAATSVPLIKFGNTTVSGKTVVRDLTVKVEGGSDLGWARLVDISSHIASSPGTYVDGLVVNCNSLKPAITGTSNPLVRFSGVSGNICRVDNFKIYNITADATTPVGIPYVDVQSHVHGKGWTISGTNAAVAAGAHRAALQINGSDNKLVDLYLRNASTLSFSIATIEVVGSRNTIDGCRADDTITNVHASATEFVWVTATSNENTFSNFFIDIAAAAGGAGAFMGRAFLMSNPARDNIIRDSYIKCGNVLGSCVFTDAGRRNNVYNTTFHWDGTSTVALRSLSPDSLLDSLVFYRSAGASAQINSTGAGSITGSNVLSTTL